MKSKRNADGKLPDVWEKHYNAMTQKTALRRLSKFCRWMDAEINNLLDAGEYKNTPSITINPEPNTNQNIGNGSKRLDILDLSSLKEETQNDS